MIGFKHPEDRGPSTLILLSILVLAGTLVYMVFVPPPSAAGVVKGRERSRQQIETEIKSLKERAQQMETQTRPYLWKGNPELITSAVLAKITDQANQRKLKLTAFRPQRTQLLDGVTELPYSVQISGPYAAVRGVVDFLDDSRNKMALRSVQIASSDSASSLVTATIGVSAFVETATDTPKEPNKEGKRG